MPLQKLTQLGGTVVCQLKPTDPMTADFRSNTFHSLVSPHIQVTKLEPKPWGESLQYLRPLISFRCLPKAVHQGDSCASYLTKPLQKAAILCRFRFFKSSKTLRCAIRARKDQKEENHHKIWPNVVSDLSLYVKSALLCIVEKWSALSVSPSLFFRVRKEKEVSQARPFLKSPQRAVLQQQRLRRDKTISLCSNNVSLTKIPWSGNLSTFLSLKSFELVKLKTLATSK